MKNKYKKLEDAIGYKFKKRKLLEAALTHRSFRFENEEVMTDNQRLEFLGDAVLGFVTAAHFYKKFREKDEGFMTSLRSQTTSGKALAGLAREISLGDYILMGKGEELSGGRKRPSNLTDALEAVIGAAYEDRGLKAVEKIFKALFAAKLEDLEGDMWADNPKGRLQEYCQGKWKKGPEYVEKRREGPAHAMVFTVEVKLRNGRKATGVGRNKQEAEANAALEVLKQLDIVPSVR